MLHPALDRPVVSRGLLDIGPQGQLIRHQTSPVEEITSIGKRLITVDRPQDAYRNSVPIPGFMDLFLAVLREVVEGAGGREDDGRIVTLSNSPSGWTVTVSAANSDADTMGALALLGCGEVLRAIALDLPDGEARRIAFVPER
ncbi:MAG: hypothetical protein AAF565_01130 [Pseudomonadota bacterium]